MNRRFPCHWSAVLLLAAGGTVSALAGEQVLQGHRFTVPEGFVVELAIPSDLVPRPVSASFDSQGRLYVTDSAGLNLPPSEQLKDPQNRILRLEDTDGDGRFDRSTVFADRVMFPQGCLWHDGSVYVAGPPSIWKFTDTDDDGIADVREEWYQGNVLTGCANDVHGPYLGPEGKLYWTKGAFERLDLLDHRGRPIRDRCAHIFRAWPDGSGLESVMSGGMDNPVEIAFTREGEPIFTSTFIDLSQPGRRDGLAHAVYGGVFGKVNSVVDERMVWRTGDLLPTMTHFGPAAVSGITRYDGEAFGKEFQHNLFVTHFNLRKVSRHVLHAEGSTYRTEDSDFLVSDQMDFHPTDVLEDADGSLLIIDTGGWYKLCCPSSQLAKADVLGAGYRVRRLLPGRGGEAAPPRPTPASYQRVAAPPSMTESTEASLKRLALMADSGSAEVFRKTISEHLTAAGNSLEARRLVRVAVEGLGRTGNEADANLLYRVLEQVPAADRFLEHSVLYALLEIGGHENHRRAVASADARVRRAALLVLEQLAPESMAVTEVLPGIQADDPALRDTARWILQRHPEWSGALAREVRNRLESVGSGVPADSRFELSLLARSDEGRPFIADWARDAGLNSAFRSAALQAMSEAGVKNPPATWSEAVDAVLQEAGKNLTQTDAALLRSAIRAAGVLPAREAALSARRDALHRIAGARALSREVRFEALQALPQGSSIDDGEFELMRSALKVDRPANERLSAAQALSRVQLSPEHLLTLAGFLREAGPVELPRLFPAFAGSSDSKVGERLLASLKDSKALRSVRPEDLLPQLKGFPDPIQQGAKTLLDAGRSDAVQDLQRLEELVEELRALKGDVRRGQDIFNSTKAACSSCHRLGYLGGDLGPDLTSIGTVRSERDLVEAVLFPSASFVRSYEPWAALLRDGEEHFGVLRRETPTEVVLATGPGAEVRIPRSEIVELRLGTLSTMPAGLDEQLTRQELADLLAFLKNTRWGVN